MNTRAAAFLVTAGFLLGCSTPQAEQVETEPLPVAQLQPLANSQPLPPGESRFALPGYQDPENFYTPKPPEVVTGRVCKLGTSCVEMDPRPFELCLVGTKRCADKARPPVEVKAPSAPKGPEEFRTLEINVPAEK